MPLISPKFATNFALTWLDAWNRHDLDSVLSHYHESVEVTSPLIAELGIAPSGRLRGKTAVKAYWAIGLERIPDLHFELIDVLAGIDRIVIVYRGHRGRVAEALTLDAAGRVVNADVSYSDAAPATADSRRPILNPASLPARTGSIYPTEALRQRVAGRGKKALGDPLGLQNFGVNLVRLEPGARSALRHWHSRQDEFIYVLSGAPSLLTDAGEQTLSPGLCAGFPAGHPDGHCLVNRGDQDAIYLEVGDRSPGDQVTYPDDDLQARGTRPGYQFLHKDGSEFAPEQAWSPAQYAENAGFVPALGGAVVDLLAPRAGERILDLGCGDGVLTETLRDLGCAVVGVDASAAMVATAQARGLDARVTDATQLTFADEFDAVFSNAALHWIRPPEAAIAGVWRALKAGGRFVGEFGGEGNVARIVAALEAALAARGLSVENPWFYPSAPTYRGMLEARGFVVRSLDIFPRPTALPGDVGGWLRTFAGHFTGAVPEAERESFVDEVVERLRPQLCDAAGQWTADYVRLRFVADKPPR